MNYLPSLSLRLLPTRSTTSKFSYQTSIDGVRYLNIGRKMSTHAEVVLPSGGKVEVPVGLFINGTYRPSSTNETFQTKNPATGQHLLNFSHASKEDVDSAVKAARLAFKGWKKVGGSERGRLLNKLADLMERDIDTLAALESLNTGKGIRIARESDITDSIGCLRYYAGMTDKYFGQSIDHFGGEKLVYTLHQPIGVCGQIIPWNYPIQMLAWKIAPALAAGCTIILKPSELTPLTALYITKLTTEAGFPNGVINVLPGLGQTTGEYISRHMDIDKVAFTGSVVTGRKVMVAAAESNLKKVTLELGGKSPVLIMESADLKEATNWTALGIWFNSGQDCCAGSRVYVHEKVFDQFISILKTKAEACAIGQPHDDKTSFGPLISELQRDKVLSHIESGRQAGAEIVTGGKKWESSEGYYVEPTILTNTTEDMKVVKEEIFGPVIVASKFYSEEEAINLANDTTYGLAAAVFTNDHRQALRMTSEINAGTVWVNQYALLHNSVPFGGFKMSGIGRELGTYGLEAYLEVKAVHHNLTQTIEWPL